MTVITQPITEKKLKKPLMDTKGATGGEATAVAAGGEDPESGGRPTARNSLLVTVSGGGRGVRVEHARRVNSLATLVVFLMSVFVFAVGLLGATYLYREFNQYKLRHFRGWCSVPYYGSDASYQALSSDERDRPMNDLFSSMSYTLQKQDAKQYFDEDIDIDLDEEAYEDITVPEFAGGRRGRFIHDFSINKTAIIDMYQARCFILPLNRSLILPPRSLYDLVTKMRSGYYDVNTLAVKEKYEVEKTPVEDTKQFGYYINRECVNLPTYSLKRVEEGRAKRSAEPGIVFTEFAGNGIIELEITNLR